MEKPFDIEIDFYYFYFQILKILKILIIYREEGSDG